MSEIMTARSLDGKKVTVKTVKNTDEAEVLAKKVKDGTFRKLTPTTKNETRLRCIGQLLAFLATADVFPAFKVICNTGHYELCDPDKNDGESVSREILQDMALYIYGVADNLDD